MNMEPERKRIFGDRLRQACIAHYGKEHGIASRLAADMDVSIQTASKWIRGTVTPETWRWGEIANLLGITVQWLTGTSHDLPEGLTGKIDDNAMDLAGQAARIVHPLVVRLCPDAPGDLVASLAMRAYDQLRLGIEPSKVSGDIASHLINADTEKA